MPRICRVFSLQPRPVAFASVAVMAGLTLEYLQAYFAVFLFSCSHLSFGFTVSGFGCTVSGLRYTESGLTSTVLTLKFSVFGSSCVLFCSYLSASGKVAAKFEPILQRCLRRLGFRSTNFSSAKVPPSGLVQNRSHVLHFSFWNNSLFRLFFK